MVEWKRWRAWLRAVHRDIGYLAIGFTVIYAVSGILGSVLIAGGVFLLHRKDAHAFFTR